MNINKTDQDVVMITKSFCFQIFYSLTNGICYVVPISKRVDNLFVQMKYLAMFFLLLVNFKLLLIEYITIYRS